MLTSEDVDRIIEETRIAPLRGRPVPFFAVVVDKELQSLIDQEGLKTETELILRRSGIPISTKAAAPWAFLYLGIEGVRSTGINAYALRAWLEFSEEVSTKRPVDATIVAPTWNDSILMIVGGARLQAIRETSKEMVERFCLDYLKANPK
jgi:hypothetical protein